MTIEELRSLMRKAIEAEDNESAHGTCDSLLLEYIGDAEVKQIHDDADFWYA